MSWPLVKLGDICDTTQGVQITKASTQSELYEGGFRYLYIADFISDKKLSFVDDIFEKKKVTTDDLVMANTGSPGRVFKGKEGILSNNLFKITFDKEVVDRDYLYLILSSEVFQSVLQQQMKGGIQKHLGHQTISRQEIPLPPLAEQKRIAVILDKADAIRQKRQQAIKLADEFLRSVFLEMFGDPVTNPKGWEVKSFGDLGQWASGGTPSRSIPEYFEGSIDWYSARELNERYLEGSLEKITSEALNNSAAKVFPSGSMLVGMYDTAALKISILQTDSASNQACANIIPNSLVNIEWLYSYIEYSKETYLLQRRGVRQKNLNLGMIKEFQLPLPPVKKQVEFVKIAAKLMLSRTKMRDVECYSKRNFNALSQKAFLGQL